MTTDEQGRPEPPEQDDERATLIGFLEFQRATLAWKCDGLAPEQLCERPVPPSPMSLLGLVRHVADVERGWWRNFVGEDATPLYWSSENRDGDFLDGTPDDVEEAFAAWRTECERAREILAATPDLSTVSREADRPVSARWLLTHMVEEYARHNGHADLLRERIDGATGE